MGIVFISSHLPDTMDGAEVVPGCVAVELLKASVQSAPLRVVAFFVGPEVAREGLRKRWRSLNAGVRSQIGASVE